MTTQASTGAAFSGSGGRSYSVTATDGSWTRLVSDVGSAQIGFAQTNQLISSVQITYVAGNAAWRIRNSVSQVTKRVGFGFVAGAGGPAPYSGGISPITLQQDDVLEVYSMAVA